MPASGHSWVRKRTTKPRLRIDRLEDRDVPTFVSAPAFTVGADEGTESNPQATVVGDFNRDGKLDVATANTGTKDVSVLLGTGTGSFQTAKNIAIGRAPTGLLAVDVNKDGKLDLITANTDDDSATVLIGNGTGGFSVGVSVAAGNGPIAVAAGDINADGKVDLAVANNLGGTVTVLIGNATGGFTLGPVVTVGTRPTAVVVADFNNDQKHDIATVSGGEGHLEININGGNGTFGAPSNYETGFVANGLAVGDFNHDGQPDLAVACNFPSNDGVSILLGNPDGTFQPFVNYSVGGQTPVTVSVGDLDGDGNPDLVTANGQFGNNSVSVLMGKADGTFGPSYVFTAGQNPIAAAIGDFNGDGVPDVAATSQGRFLGTSVGNVNLLLGNGDGTLLSAQSVAVPGPGESVAADLTGDGIVDLAVVSSTPGYHGVHVLPGFGNGLFGTAIPTVEITFPTGVAAGDFDGDTKNDLAITTGNGVTILTGNGDGTFGARLDVPVAGGPEWVVVDDFNNDTNADLAVALGSGSAGAAVLLGTGTGTFAFPLTIDAGGASTYLTTGDLNADGKKDLAVVNGSASKVSVVLGLGNGSFTAAESHDTYAGPGSVGIGDFNGDGKKDLAVPTFMGPPVSSVVTIFENGGAGTFTRGDEYVTDSNPKGIAVADVTGDGRLDLVTVNNFADNVVVLPGQAGGTFGDPITYSVGSRPTWITTADFNRDGKADLAVTNSIAGTVTILQSPSVAAARFRVRVLPTSTVAGATAQVVVGALDNGGRLLPNYTGTVKLTSTDGIAGLPAPYAFAAADKGWHRFNVTLKTAGIQDVVATSGGITGAGSVTVVPALANHLRVVGTPGPVAGSQFDVTVSALDKFNNVAPTFVGLVRFSTNDPAPGVVLPADYTFTADDKGTHTFAGGVTLFTAGPRTVSAKFFGSNWATAAGAVTVVAADATQLTLAGSTSATAGVALPLTVTARDAYGNVATGYTGTVHLASSDGTATLPDDYAFTANDKGAHTFQPILKRTGTQWVSATAPSVSGFQLDGIVVKAGTAAALAFVGQPADTLAATRLTPPVTVQVADAFGNPVGAGVRVKLAVGTNPGGGAVTGPPAKTDATGLATFTRAAITKGGQGYTLVAKAGTGTSAPSDPFTVYKATKFGLALSATETTAGTALTLTVTALDRLNTPDPTYRGTIRFTSTAGALADLPPDYTFQAADNGQKAFPVTLRKAGKHSVVVADTTNARVKGIEKVTVAAGDVSRFLLSGLPTTVKANVARFFTVTAQDAFGNTVTGYTGTVRFTNAGGTAVLPDPYTFAASDRGKHVFKVTFQTPGANQSLTVEDTTNAGLSGTQGGITVT